MKFMKTKFLLLSLILFVTGAKAGILTVSGVYQGKNLYVQNPFTGNMKDFCTNDVFVNDVKVMSNIQSSAYEIDLSNLKLNDPVTVKITHKDDCKPKVLNPQVIRASSSFQFSSFNIDPENIMWATKGEKPRGKFFVEHFINNSWVTVKEISGKESGMLNNYDIKSAHHSKLNKYRIKYLENDGQVFYSQVLEFNSDLAPITWYPKRVTDKIYLSREADFEVLDAYGNVVRKGAGKEINMADLSSGVYYLNVDNTTNKVLKK
ncbi:MAG: hypothetical protein J7604_11520 [Sporocytophaga sp.]|nr:hypothetical protein [Sporocytophaga sp.]